MNTLQVFRTTLVVLLTVVLAYIVYNSSHILVVLLIAIIIASALRPLVMWMHRRGLNYGFAALASYGLLALGLLALSVLIIPPITTQLSGYITNQNSLANQLISAQTWIETQASKLTNSQVTLFDVQQIRQTTNDAINQIIAGLPTLAGAFGGLFSDFILVLIMGIYWLTERDSALKFLSDLFSFSRRAQVETIVQEAEHSLGTYTRGVMMVATFVGIANFVILRLFQVPNAATLGFIIGATTIMPLIGGYIGAGASVFLALLISPVYALITLGSFVAVAQVENHLLTPRVMSRSVGLDPLLIIVLLFVGFDLGGAIGGLIIVPVAGVIMIVLRHMVIEPRRLGTQPQMVEGGILLDPSATEKVTTAKLNTPDSIIQVASH